jgi:hypothetical protein
MLAIAFLLTSSMGVFAQQPGGICCDPDAGAFYASFITCITSEEEGGSYAIDG